MSVKTCPICHARAFSDAAICYGCMHRFGSVSSGTCALSSEAEWEPEEVNQKIQVTGRKKDQHAAIEQVSFVKEQGASNGKHVGHVDEEHAQSGSSATPAQNVSDSSRGVSDSLQADREPSFALQQKKKSEIPFDAAGWVVRFELPGGVVSQSGLLSTEQSGEAKTDRGYYHEQDNAGMQKHACPLVIHISPAGQSGGESRIAGAFEEKNADVAAPFEVSYSRAAS